MDQSALDADRERSRRQFPDLEQMLRRPTIRWCSWMPRHLLWWGGVALTLGGVVFCLATTGRLAGQFNAVHYTTVQKVSSPPMGDGTGGAWSSLAPPCLVQ